MIIGLLGILKSGGAYVPIDPEFPQTRINHIITEAGINLVVTNNKYNHLIEPNKEQELVIMDDEDWLIIEQQNKNALHTGLKPNHLAYVIYTSGSTGHPKGVMVEHRNCLNTLLDHIERFEISEKDRVLQFTPFTFDVSVCEIFMALLTGAGLVLIDKQSILTGGTKIC